MARDIAGGSMLVGSMLSENVIMILFWPHVHENIITLPFKFIIESFSSSQIGAPLGLLNGEFYFTKETPKSDIFVSLFNKLPEFIIISYLLFLLLFFKSKNFYDSKFNSFAYKIILIFLIIIFPNLILFIIPYSIYDGIRHFLYIIPYINIIPALFIYYLFENIKAKLNKFLFLSIIAFFFYYLFVFISLTPYQYVYLNTINGKFINAHKKFENDYWGTSLKELISQISNNKTFINMKKIKYATCGVSDGAVKYYLQKIKKLRFEEVKRDEEYDYIS